MNFLTNINTYINSKKCIYICIAYLVISSFVFLHPQFEQRNFYYAIWITLIILAIFPIYFFQDYFFSKTIKKKNKKRFESFLDRKTLYTLHLIFLFLIGYIFILYLCITPYFTSIENDPNRLFKEQGYINIRDNSSGRYHSQITELNTINRDTYDLYCSFYNQNCALNSSNQLTEVTFQKLEKRKILVHQISSATMNIDFTQHYLLIKRSNTYFIFIFLIPSILIFLLIIRQLPKAYPLKRKIYF